MHLCGQCVWLCVLLVSCGGQPRLMPPDTPRATPLAGTPIAVVGATPEAGFSEPGIGEIVWVASSDPVSNAPREIVASYVPEAPRITAAVPIRMLPADASISATWEYNETPLDVFSRRIVLAAPADRLWISFHIDRAAATPWPAGTYEIAISLDGTEMRREAVAVAPEG